MVFGLNTNAIIVIKQMKKKYHIIDRVKNITAIENAKKDTYYFYLFMSKILTVELEKRIKLNKFIIGDMFLLIKNALHTLKQDGMLGKKTRKVLIVLKSGKHYVENLIGDVRDAKKRKNLPKIISDHFQKKAQTTYQIFSHFVEIAIVENGLSDIYENPDLLEAKS